MGELNRRHFLTATAAAALPRTALAQSAAEPVSVGFIGTGMRGNMLLDYVIKLPGAKIKALCDIKPDRLDSTATKAARDNPKTYSDYRKLLEARDVQAVYIAVPCDLHVEMAIAAIQSGKHIYLEKPVGITPESIAELLRAAKGAKQVIQTGHVLRSFPFIAAAEKSLREGLAGKVIMIRAWRHSAGGVDLNSSSIDWYYFRRRSGDLLVENAVHNIDVCNWLAGSRPERATGFGGTLLYKNIPPGRDMMDGYTLSYEYANGVEMSFTQLVFHPSGMQQGGMGYQVYGTEGAVDVQYGQSKSYFYKNERGAKPVLLSDAKEDGQAIHFQAFLDAIRTGNRDVVGGLKVGAVAALSCIMGRDAILQKRIMTWRDMGVEV